MTMTFKLPSGRHVTATYDQELVDILRRDGMGLSPDLNTEAFMYGIAQRARIEHGIEVHTDSARTFLFDLQAYDLIVPVDDPWSRFVLDGIHLSLYGPLALPGWKHRLIWSSELPFVISTKTVGPEKDNRFASHRPIHPSEMSKSGYQQDWVQEYRDHLRRLTSLS